MAPLGIFRNPGDSYVDMGYPVPGGEVDDSCHWETEDGLELPDCLCGRRTEDSIRGYMGDGGIDAGNGVELVLDLLDLFSACSDC